MATPFTSLDKTRAKSWGGDVRGLHKGAGSWPAVLLGLDDAATEEKALVRDRGGVVPIWCGERPEAVQAAYRPPRRCRRRLPPPLARARPSPPGHLHLRCLRTGTAPPRHLCRRQFHGRETHSLAPLSRIRHRQKMGPPPHALGRRGLAPVAIGPRPGLANQRCFVPPAFVPASEDPHY